MVACVELQRTESPVLKDGASPRTRGSTPSCSSTAPTALTRTAPQASVYCSPNGHAIRIPDPVVVLRPTCWRRLARSRTGTLLRVTEKRCAKCRAVKPRDGFPVQQKQADGRSPWCRSCHAQANREYRQRQGDHLNAARQAVTLILPDRTERLAAGAACAIGDRLSPGRGAGSTST